MQPCTGGGEKEIEARVCGRTVQEEQGQDSEDEKERLQARVFVVAAAAAAAPPTPGLSLWGPPKFTQRHLRSPS